MWVSPHKIVGEFDDSMIDWKENWGEALKIQEASIMHGWTKRSLALVMVVALVFSTAGFSASAGETTLQDEASGESMIADFLFLRPLGFAATVVGAVFFVVSLPFSGPTGSTGEAFDRLVAEPSNFTFTRPLGKVYH